MHTSSATLFTEENSPHLADTFEETMASSGGFYWGRIGGSDYEAVARRYAHDGRGFVDRVADRYFSKDRIRVRELNGFFDKKYFTTRSNFDRYLELMDTSYLQTPAFTYANANLVRFIEGTDSAITPQENYTEVISNDKSLATFRFVESLTPFLRSFKSFAEGKRVLIVSPFSRSVQAQLEVKDKLIRDYTFPVAEYLTYTSPITYNNHLDVMKGTIPSRTSNWLDEVDLMSEELENLDFDIALLSCGSYATPLGVSIMRSGRRALYLGGMLNVVFNLYGARYDIPEYNSKLVLENRIDPIEAAEYETVRGGRAIQNEGMRAYFRSK
jgi:hypothetical protein